MFWLYIQYKATFVLAITLAGVGGTVHVGDEIHASIGARKPKHPNMGALQRNLISYYCSYHIWV